MSTTKYGDSLVMFLPSANASSKDLTKGTATFSLNPPLIFPNNSKIKLALHSFSFTNYFTNITTGVNDKLYYTDNFALPEKYLITITEGSYNVSELSDAINLAVINNGHASGLITLTPDFPTNKVILSISVAGWAVNFKALVSPYALLGFTSGQLVPALALTTGAYSEYSPNVATFNSIQEIYVKTSLTYNSLYAGSQSNIVASVTPVAPIGSIQRHEPINLIYIDAFELSGATNYQLTISLTDQSGNALNMSDDYATTLLINIS